MVCVVHRLAVECVFIQAAATLLSGHFLLKHCLKHKTEEKPPPQPLPNRRNLPRDDDDDSRYHHTAALCMLKLTTNDGRSGVEKIVLLCAVFLFTGVVDGDDGWKIWCQITPSSPPPPRGQLDAKGNGAMLAMLVCKMLLLIRRKVRRKSSRFIKSDGEWCVNERNR